MPVQKSLETYLMHHIFIFFLILEMILAYIRLRDVMMHQHLLSGDTNHNVTYLINERKKKKRKKNFFLNPQIFFYSSEKKKKMLNSQ